MKIIIFLLTLTLIESQSSDELQDLLNTCVDGKNHKKNSGPEVELYKQCSIWANRSCCTPETSRNIHHTHMYNFNHDHCRHKRNMSDRCRKHFIQDLCFYECTPNGGPWLIKTKMKTRKNRIYGAPLCASDCESWFDACVDDFTCTDNWLKNFNWSSGENMCRAGDECRTFKEIFGNAKTFCEKIWDHAWKYTDDDRPCMRIWFDSKNGNPNDNVARLKIEELTRKKQDESYWFLDSNWIVYWIFELF